MKCFLGAVMALALVRVEGGNPNHGNCVDEFCVTVHAELKDFGSAQKSCKDKGGDLMTVRTTGADRVLSELLTGHTGNFWIGLRYMSDLCSEPTTELKGYTWITGDQATNFTNWRNQNRICSPSCVSVSKEDPKWTDRFCDQTIEGYLCEYKNIIDKCRPLTSEAPVLYETPFGFAREDLQQVPGSSNATARHLGTKYICYDSTWHKAPWNCEVYKGGCEHDCHKTNNTYACTCLPGFQLESNGVRCRRAHSNPCLQANCSQECMMQGESPVCGCRDGYELGEDGKTCKDIDNCDNKTLCPGEHSYCVNTAGGFECLCKSGFRKEKDTCVDEDECFLGLCEHTCENTMGSYNCQCGEGFKISPKNRHICVLHCAHLDCPAVDCDFNKPHQCNCPLGFILEERMGRYFCTDIDECESTYCDQKCQNTPGGFICSCYPGFHLTDKTECVRTKGFSTTSSSVVPPTSSSPPIQTSSISSGGLLGLIVFLVLLILLMVCIIHYSMKRCGKISTDKSHSKDMHDLQQVTTERYVKKHSITNIKSN